MLFADQIAVCIVLLGYFWQRRTYLHRRNRQSWESLTAQLQRYPSDSSSRWIRLQSARVAMEMADYAERNGGSALEMPDLTPLISLRNNAMAMRVASLKGMLGFVPSDSGS